MQDKHHHAGKLYTICDNDDKIHAHITYMALSTVDEPIQFNKPFFFGKHFHYEGPFT